MSDFRRVSAEFWASPQIGPDQVAEAQALGVKLILNNRPDGESPDEPQGAEIERAALEAGMAYVAIPVTHAGFSHAQVDAMVDALEEAQGPVLAYCRSGTRSTLLWSLAQAKLGRSPDAIAEDAAGAGYDVTAIRPLLEQLSGRTGD